MSLVFACLLASSLVFGGCKSNSIIKWDNLRIANFDNYRALGAGCLDVNSPKGEKKLCVAYKRKYYSICVNPINVKFAASYVNLKLKNTIKVGTVIGFPLGETSTDVKLYELKKAISDGAEEVDVVLCVSRIKSGDFAYVKNEISRIVKASKKVVVKIIIETCYLTKTEIERVSLLCAKNKVDFIQTSTGFGTGGAGIEDIQIISDTVRGKCQIKASGGIENATQAIIMARAGAVRIGTSREI